MIKLEFDSSRNRKMEYIRCENLTPEHALEVAKLHIDGIHTGFISSLGIDFVTAIYKAIAKSKISFGFTTKEEERVLGFVTFTTNLPYIGLSQENKKYGSPFSRTSFDSN